MTVNPAHAPPTTPQIVVGLMSGTSADGTDAAVVELSGRPPSLNWKLLSFQAIRHPQPPREALFAAFRPESATVDRLCALEFLLGEAFADAARQAIVAADLTPQAVDLIGSYGQTVWHIPDGPNASTLQLGKASVIAECTGITTVSNFWTRDVAAGGQGAPLVSYVDALLLSHPTRARAAQNIGGIGNVTYLPPTHSGEPPIAFDTGPGTMLIDDAMLRITDGTLAYDVDGALAASGTVHVDLLAELLLEPYLSMAPPKTTGRELFGEQYGQRIWMRCRELELDNADILATVTAFTAHSIARAYRDFLPRLPEDIVVSGGGARNRTLMRMLAEQVETATVLTSDEFGMPADAKEAIAFAVFAYETWHGRPSNLPSATGARHPVVMGSITPGRRVGNGQSTR